MFALWLLPGPATTAAGTPTFADGAFETTWQRTDLPVAEGLVDGTWIWGPGPLTEAFEEPYAESPGGQRLIQYFDKSRMEITDPGASPDNPWYVTNGRLVSEMITATIQLGDNRFGYPGEPGEVGIPEINVAGDLDDERGITYKTINLLRNTPVHPEGSTITAVVSRDGTIAHDPDLAAYQVTAGPLSPETGHRTASIFWEFMTSQRPVLESGELQVASLFPNPYYATGLPVIEAYWTTVRVAGTDHQVLLQCFERRCLTYTPGNPEGWQVEADNVGRHYYEWRYGAQQRIAFRRVADTAETSGLYLIAPDGSDLEFTGLVDLDFNQGSVVWSPDGRKLAFVGNRPGYQGVFVLDLATSDILDVTQPSGGYDPAWSPDGRQLTYASHYRPSYGESPAIRIVNTDGSGQRIVTEMDGPEIEVTRSPDWSPDGKAIVFSAGTDLGSSENPPTHLYRVNADGTGLTQLTNMPGVNDRYPDWSADGERIVFRSDRDGRGSIFVMNADGSGVVQISDGDATGFDLQPRWSPDSAWISFTRSEHGYNNETYIVRPDGSELRNLGSGWESSWSSSSDRIVLSNGRHLEIVSIADGTRTALTSDPDLFDSWPIWSPLPGQ